MGSMNDDIPREDEQSSVAIAPEQLLEALRAELAQSAKERGHWNDEAGASVAPDDFERAMAAAIGAIAARYGLD